MIPTYPKWSLLTVDYDRSDPNAHPGTVLVVRANTDAYPGLLGVMLCHTDYDCMSDADVTVTPVGKPYRLVVQTDLWFTIRTERVVGRLGWLDSAAVSDVRKVHAYDPNTDDLLPNQGALPVAGIGSPMWKYKEAEWPRLRWLQQSVLDLV